MRPGKRTALLHGTRAEPGRTEWEKKVGYEARIVAQERSQGRAAGRPRPEHASFEEWVKMDLEYIDNWSLWLDLKLVARTALAVLGMTGQ